MLSHTTARQRAETIVSQMTLDEKIAQINFRAPAIGRLNIPDYNYWNEALHGIARAGVATVFPQAIGLAAMFDEDLMEEIAEVIAIEGRAKYNQYHQEGDHDIYKGLTYWSPNINIFRDPRWGRGQETYGEDPYLTARLGVAFIKGLQGNGPYLKLAACAKHFAVHSGPEADRHSFDAVVSEKDLYETYLPAFEAAVKEADIESVMGAYNAINGVPAVVNDTFLNDILRKNWQFKGHVVSDYAALEDVDQNHHFTKTPAETMALAMKVGCNLCAGNISHHLHEALDKGLVTETDITRSVVELYTTRVRLGMFDDDNPYDAISYEQNDCAAHHALSLKAAQKSIVLLKNDGLLPLKKGQLTSIAVVGPNADSIEALRGNYYGVASRSVTFLSGIQDAFLSQGRVFYASGCHLYNDHAESTLSRPHERESEAIIAAEHADVVIACLGLDPTIEGEQGDAGNVYGSGDKENVYLPPVQVRLLEKLLATGKPVIAVIAAGSAISLGELNHHPNLKALLHTWYPGSYGGQALSDILFGDISPSGKLPVTFYHNTDHLPAFSDYAMYKRTYRYMEEEALFPFGFGLTYGNVSLHDLQVENKENVLTVSVTVKNNSRFTVEEVIQVYGKTNAADEVRNYKLIGFKRVSLHPETATTVTLKLPLQNLAVVDTHGEKRLDGTEATLYVHMASPSQRTEKLTNQTGLTETIAL